LRQGAWVEKPLIGKLLLQTCKSFFIMNDTYAKYILSLIQKKVMADFLPSLWINCRINITMWT